MLMPTMTLRKDGLRLDEASSVQHGSTSTQQEETSTAGTVTSFIPDLAERGGTSAAEGVAVDHDGNVYGAEVGPRDVKKYITR